MNNDLLKAQECIKMLELQNYALREELCCRCRLIGTACQYCQWAADKEPNYRDEGARVD